MAVRWAICDMINGLVWRKTWQQLETMASFYSKIIYTYIWYIYIWYIYTYYIWYIYIYNYIYTSIRCIFICIYKYIWLCVYGCPFIFPRPVLGAEGMQIMVMSSAAAKNQHVKRMFLGGHYAYILSMQYLYWAYICMSTFRTDENVM
jgi:hypothetical protein